MLNINTLREKVLHELSTISNYRHQLIFLAGDCHSYDYQQLASEIQIPYINISLDLSRTLIDLPISKRPRKVASCFKELLDSLPETTYLLDHIEVLFDPSLRLNPGTLLENMSRNDVFIIPWYGRVTETELIYAEPGYPEYFHYPYSEVVLIPL